MRLHRLGAFAVLALVTPAIRAQPPAADAAKPNLAQKVAYADSLAAARERWKRSRIQAYDIQAHRECPCFGEATDTAPRLYQVLGNRIVAAARGKPRTLPSWPTAVQAESLFAKVETALLTDRIRIDSLRFDPDYGIPLLLHTDSYLELTDLWTRIVVDSFAVRYIEGWTVDSAIAYRRRGYARVRLGYLDSLARARRKWDSAGVLEYDIQAHGECFCFGGERDSAQRIYTVRDKRVIASKPGKALVGPIMVSVVAESIFADVERTLRTDGLVIERLQFHPELGLPLKLHTDSDQGVTDSYFRMTVDSLAVRRSRPPIRKP